MSLPIVTMAVAREPDLVAVRQRARQIAEHLGFDTQDQTRIATAVSEIVRNALVYAGAGQVEFSVQSNPRLQMLWIDVQDRGPGISNADEILQGRYVSPTGMGLGIIGSRRLMDQFRIDTKPGEGTTVRLGKLVPAWRPAITAADIARLTAAFARQGKPSAMEELQQQNHELVRALDELRRRQDELARLNAELEDTNRGVVALYAELDEKADSLRRADDMKSRFLSNMSHEFRTPLNSIRALSQLLLDRADGDLTAEQEMQVSLVRRAADDLTELVNDLLDLAKVEAGKTVVRPGEVEVGRLFGALRGMLRPLLSNDAVALVFDDPVDLPILVTDESKVSQILRNFISNALKFTDAGEVRVSARRGPEDVAGGTVIFSVTDTGIGIAPEDQERIFQEFSQVESPVQKRVRGTGLGLPLSKRLAHLLGAAITVQSTPAIGSTFSLTLPVVYREAAEAVTTAPPAMRSTAPTRTKRRVLLVDDDDASRYMARKWLVDAGYELFEEPGGTGVHEAARTHVPDVIVLDLVMPDTSGFEVLQELAGDTVTQGIPVVIYTSVSEPPARERLGAQVIEVVSKNQSPAAGAAALRGAVARATQFVSM
jgi:signal transduction histidine kinase